MIGFEKPPAWAADAIWYQIFPERFRNHDPSNDPTLEDLRGAYPDDVRSPWQVHPWHSDWYERQPWEQGADAESFWRHVQRRRYGGDLQGVWDGLDHVQRLVRTPSISIRCSTRRRRTSTTRPRTSTSIPRSVRIRPVIAR